MKALVLAAGRGTRIAAVSAGRPKPLLDVGGESVLGRNLRWIAESGIHDVWINLHHRPEEIQQAIGDGTQFGVQVRYSVERRLLGTAGAARNLSSAWDDTFLVVYGDNLVRFDVHELVQAHRAKQTNATLALFDPLHQPHTGIAGGRVKLDADRRVVGFLEGADDSYSSLVNAGAYLLEPQIVSLIPREQPYDFGRDLFPAVLANRLPLYGHVISGYCLGLDTPDSYYRALELVTKGQVELS